MPQCSPPCSPKAVCQENNTCLCRPFYQGDGFTCAGETQKNQRGRRQRTITFLSLRPGVAHRVTLSVSLSAVMEMCQVWNGGCAQIATCSQKGDKVSCTCPKGHSGDGFTCQPIDLCASGDNGGCHKHATCTMTAPVRTRCSSIWGFYDTP